MKFLSQEKTELKPVSNHALIIFHFDGEKLCTPCFYNSNIFEVFEPNSQNQLCLRFIG